MNASPDGARIPRSNLDLIAKDLTNVGARYFDHADKLAAQGFTSFIPYLDHEFAACSDSEKALHREFLVEEAKEILGSWGPTKMVLAGSQIGYTSPLISKLRAERDAQGLDFNYFRESRAADTWKCYLSPCRIERHRLAIMEPESSQALRDRRSSAYKLARANERQIVAQGIFPRSSDTNPRSLAPLDAFKLETRELNDARKLARNYLGQELGRLGYKYSSRLSTTTWFTFTHSLPNSWQLRFIFSISRSHVDPYLLFCHSSLPKRPTGHWDLLYDYDAHVEIRLKHSAPLFHEAYYSFDSLNDFGTFVWLSDLEIVIKAILELYGMEHEYLAGVFEKHSRDLS